MIMTTWMAMLEIIIAGGAPSALASAALDICIQQACTVSGQTACSVAAGTQICDEDRRCQSLPERAYARVIDKADGQWKVETPLGAGLVQARDLIVDEKVCSNG